MIKNKNVALTFRLFSCAIILLGLLTQFGFFRGNINLTHVMYYTIQSNLLALALFVILTCKTVVDIRKNGKTGNAGYFPRFEMVVVIDLLLTLVVYWVLLAPGSFDMGGNTGLFSFGNLAVHLFAPLLCLIDYFLFSKPGYLKYRDVYAVLVFPVFYVVLSTAAGLLGYVYRLSSIDGKPVRFPYFFIDWDQLGAAVLLYILGLVVFFLILSHIVYFTDKKRAKNQIKEKAN